MRVLIKLIAGVITGFIVVIVSMRGFNPGVATAANRANLDALATATLRPGGLGDLVIHETTLGTVLDRYGCGKPSMLFGDHAMIELAYAGGDLTIMFNPPEGSAEVHQIMAAGPRALTLDFMAGADVVRANHPGVAALTVNSIAVRGDFFRGATEDGLALGDPLAKAYDAEAPEDRGPGRIVAGTTTTRDLGRPIVRDGILIYPDSSGGGSSRIERNIDALLPDRVDMFVAYGAAGTAGEAPAERVESRK